MIEISVSSKSWNVIPDFSRIAHEAIKATLQHVGDLNKKNPTISVVLADDLLLRQLNKKHRKKNYPTNVLSFSYMEELNLSIYSIKESLPDEFYIGDIAISIDTLLQESVKYNIPLNDHFKHILVHGVLHLLGYDHETNEKDAEIMQKAEIEILSLLNVDNPYEQ